MDGSGTASPRRRGGARQRADHRRAGDPRHADPDQLPIRASGPSRTTSCCRGSARELATAVPLLHQHSTSLPTRLELLPRDAVLERDGLVRRSFTGCGTSSGQPAASVPGRGEYLKTNPLS
jgi:hypothetical protein